MAEEEPPSVSRDLQELQRKLGLLLESFQNNSKVVAFMKSPVGRFLDRHPFLVLTVLMFVTMSAIPVGFFLLIVVLTSLVLLWGPYYWKAWSSLFVVSHCSASSVAWASYRLPCQG